MKRAMKWAWPPVLVAACTAEAGLSGEEILKKVAATFAAVRVYSVELNVAIDLDRLRVPAMKVKMYYKQPDKVHFESESFAMLPKESIALNPERLLSRYSIERVEEEQRDDRKTYLLTLEPRQNTRNLRKLTVSVDAERWIILWLHSGPFDGREMSAEFSHESIEGYWLPTELLVTFTSDTALVGDIDLFDQTPAPRTMQPPRTGTIKIHYTNYKINTGLSDELFNQKQDKPSKE